MPDPIKLGLDYSARRLPGASIKAAGYSFVFRYLDFPGQRFPALSADEYADLTRNGVEVHAIFEINTHDPSGGRDAGKRNAATAVQSARSVGLPHGSAIFMCSDAPQSTWNYSMDTAMAYLDAARAVIEDSGYVIGAYGFREFIYAAQDGGHADVFWLCGAESGVRDGIHAYQWNNGRVYVDGLECDLNKMYTEIGDTLSVENVRNGLAGWVKEDLAPGTDQRTLIQKLVEETEINIIPDDPEVEPYRDQLGNVIGAVDRRLHRVEAALAALQTGGVSKETIAEIAVDAVKDELSD